MKKAINISVLIFLFALCACNNPKSTADQLMEDIFNGDFGYTQGVNGVFLLGGALRTTDRMMEHLKATEDEIYNMFTDKDELEPMVFNIPKNIKSYKFLESWGDSENEMLKTEPVHERYYNANEYLASIYKNYENFKSQKITECENLKDCEYNEERGFIKYSENVMEKRFVYRVETLSDILQVSIVLYKIREEWKLGAVYSKSI